MPTHITQQTHRVRAARTFAATLGSLALSLNATAREHDPYATALHGALVAHAATTAQPDAKARADLELRVYDTSDLPPNTLESIARSFVGGMVSSVAPNLVALEASPEQHGVMRDALAQVRALTGDRVTIEVAVRRVNDVSGVRVGESAPESILRTPALRHVARSTTRRAATPMRSVESVSYVKNFVPVVGSQSSSLSPEVDTLHFGLDVTVVVMPERDGATLAQVQGHVSNGEVRDGPTLFPVVTHGDPGDGSTIQLPAVAVRSLDSTVSVRSDAHVVFAIVDDPTERGARLVATVRVAPAE